MPLRTVERGPFSHLKSTKIRLDEKRRGAPRMEKALAKPEAARQSDVSSDVLLLIRRARKRVILFTL